MFELAAVTGSRWSSVGGAAGDDQGLPGLLRLGWARVVHTQAPPVCLVAMLVTKVLYSHC